MQTKTKQQQKKPKKEKGKWYDETPTQIPCYACGDLKLQLLLITCPRVRTQLDLLCLSCGLLQTITLTQKTNLIQQEEIEDKPSYIK